MTFRETFSSWLIMQFSKKHRKCKKTQTQTCNNWSKKDLFSSKLSFKILFSENLWEMEMKKQIFINEPLSLGLSILTLREILVCEFWYDYVKPKNGRKCWNKF